MCRELYGHIWWRRGWSEIAAVGNKSPVSARHLCSPLFHVFPLFSMFFLSLWILLWHTRCSLAGYRVTEVSTWPQLFEHSTVVWQSQLPLALRAGLSPFCHCYFFSLPLYAITFKETKLGCSWKNIRILKDCCVKSQTLQSKLSNQANFPKCWHWVSLPSLIDAVQASSPGTALILSCAVAKSQSTAPASTCGGNDSSSFHTLVRCSRWGVSLFHY